MRLSGSLAAFALLACLPPAARAADEEPRLLDRILTPTGALTVRADAAQLSVVYKGPKMTHVHPVRLERILPGAQVVDARVAFLGAGDFVVALSAKVGNELRYHWVRHALDAETSERWIVSEPIFRETGEPFRIVEVRNPDGDGIEITFRRGRLDVAVSSPTLEEKVYVDCCPTDEKVHVKGRTLFFDTDHRIETPAPPPPPPPAPPPPPPTAAAPPPAATPTAVEPAAPRAPVARDGPAVRGGSRDAGAPPATISVLLLRDGSRQVNDAFAKAAGSDDAALLRALGTAFGKPEWRRPDALSKVQLDIRADREVPWRDVETILQKAAMRRIYRIRLGTPSSTAGYDVPLPTDFGQAPSRSARVSVSSLGVTVGESDAPVPSEAPERAPDDLSGVTRQLATLRERGAEHALVVVRSSATVTYGDVLDVVAAARDAHFTDVRFVASSDPSKPTR